MEFEGKVWKDGNMWLIECPLLDAMTQGTSKNDAIFMLKDVILLMIDIYFNIKNDVDIIINTYPKGIIGISCNQPKVLLSLALRKQREKSGSTVRTAARRLGTKSPNGYAQYEKGKTNISLDQFDKLMFAANPNKQMFLR